MKYQLSEKAIEEINRILNDRGSRSVKIKIEDGQIAVFAVSEKIIIKK